MKDYEYFIILSELVLEGNIQDATHFSRQNLMKISKHHPEYSKRVLDVLRKNKSTKVTKNVRFAKKPLPVDQDSRLELIKTSVSTQVSSEIRWPNNVQKVLDEVLYERDYEEKLISVGLQPLTSLLFVGPPGVGKTLAAAWLALKLNKPFYVLDLSAVMSSYLGRTGSNIRTVLDFAKNESAVLLLDEFDAIAKRRDDSGEIGELKRLVTVLLQEIETWPNDGILVAATNHEELLDPAVWRRFDKTIVFPFPSCEDINKFLKNSMTKWLDDDTILPILSFLFEGETYSSIDKKLKELRKKAILSDQSLQDVVQAYVYNELKDISRSDKEKMKELAIKLIEANVSHRKASEITGISRPTISKYISSSKYKIN